jgi:hypothetical protein
MFVLALLAGCKERPAAPAATSASPAPPGAVSTGAAASPTAAPGAAPVVDRTTPLPNPLPEVAARVNGQPISSRHVKIYAETSMNNGSIPKEERIYAYRHAVQQLIVRELLLQEAMVRGIAAETKALEEVENKARTGYQDEKEWARFLAKQGLTPATYKTELRAQFTVNALVRGEFEKVPDTVPDAELERFYAENPGEFTSANRVRISHILVRAATPEHKQIKRPKVEGLLEQIRGGADFAEIARKHSEDKGSAGKGGALDAFGAGEMPPALAPLGQAAEKLKPGEVSGIVETAAGLHIVKLHERLSDQVVPLEAIREDLRKHLVQRKRSERMETLVNGLRAKATIETFL